MNHSPHTGYTQAVTKGGYFAVCPQCGMLATPDRVTIEEAKADLAEHAKEMEAESC